MASVVTTKRSRAVAVTQVRLNLRQRKTAAQIEALGWRAWYAEMFGHGFVAALAPHHVEAIEWHWKALTAKLRGDYFRYDTYISIWSRGHMKSTIARRIAVADACLSTRAGKGGYCLYVSGTKDKVRGHALSLETLITSKKVRQYYPALGAVKKSAAGQSKGWTKNFIYTDAGYVFHFASLDEGIAGANVDNVRPTLIVPDDIDDRKSSPAVAEARYQVFTREVLPTKQAGTLFFLAQNLINRFSVTYRIFKGRVRILANRFPTKPIPAIRNLETQPRTVDGIVKDVVVSGEPTWKEYGLARAQSDIDTYGLEAFMAENQHNVEQQKSGMILPEWDERVHVITWSEFAKVYGQRSIPNRWTRYVGHDWGNTHPCVVSCVATAGEGDPLPGTHFLFAGLTFPQNTQSDDVALAMIERLAPHISTAHLRNVSPDIVARYLKGGVTGLLHAPRELAKTTISEQVAEWASASSFAMWHMSHEQKTIRDNYIINYGLPFSACNPGASGGVEQIRSYLRADYSQPHPFRPGAKGLAAFYFIVDDDQAFDADGNSAAKDDKGLKLWREQIPEWIWRDPTLTELGMTADKPVKVNDDAGNCLIGSTKVWTSRGDVPISKVVAGDLVMTRFGWRKVEHARCTAKDQEVYEVLFADGRTLTGTANHPVWTENRGWIRLRCLLNTDTILLCSRDTSQAKVQRSLSFGESSFTATQTASSILRAVISSRTFTRDGKGFNRFTLKSGKRQMGRFLMDMKSTILTATPLITSFPIWNAFPSLNTLRFTLKRRLAHLKDSLTWPRFNPCPANGILRQRVWSGIERMPKQASTTTSRLISGASFAERRLWRNWQSESTVRSNVHGARVMEWARKKAALCVVNLLSKRASGGNIAVRNAGGFLPIACEIGNANNAEKLFLAAGERVNSVPNAILAIRAAGKADVYNLQVAEHPEFFANGVLVHNCLMMVFAHFSLNTAPMTTEQQVEARISERLRADNAPAASDNLDGWLAARMLAMSRAQQAMDSADDGTGISFWDDLV